MFSGQGSQYYQMGRPLYLEHDGFRSQVDYLNNMAITVVGHSPIDEVFDPNKGISTPFDNQLLSSLAIYLIECALTRTLADYDIKPRYTLGSSLGMFAACTVAGCFNEREGFHYIKSMMNHFECNADKGSMIAVIDSPDVFYSNHQLNSKAELAGINFASSFVISVPQDNLASVETFLKSNNIIFQKMPVTIPYHSKWVDNLKSDFQRIYSNIPSRSTKIPVICCSGTQLLHNQDSETLWNAVRKPMQFLDSIEVLESSGPKHYIDLGPSGTLATFLKYGLAAGSKSKTSQILTPFKQNTQGFNELVGLNTTC